MVSRCMQIDRSKRSKFRTSHNLSDQSSAKLRSNTKTVHGCSTTCVFCTTNSVCKTVYDLNNNLLEGPPPRQIHHCRPTTLRQKTIRDDHSSRVIVNLCTYGCILLEIKANWIKFNINSIFNLNVEQNLKRITVMYGIYFLKSVKNYCNYRNFGKVLTFFVWILSNFCFRAQFVLLRCFVYIVFFSIYSACVYIAYAQSRRMHELVRTLP